MTTSAETVGKKFNIDTVENAAKTPDTELPWAELGLKQNEFDEVVKVLGRRPTGAELAMYSVMWSEHCSYKSSKNHLRQFGEKVTEEMKKDMLVGIGENAGVTNLGDGWAVTFKIESHNSPSFVEPYQGAATGIGGIVRDIISMGARPVAVMDPLRFGAIDHPDTARVMHGAVAGIGWLRQLAWPAEHRRRNGVRLRVPGQPAGQRAGSRRHAPRRHPLGQRLRQGQQGSPFRCAHRRRRHWRRLRAGLGVLRRHQARPSAPPSR